MSKSLNIIETENHRAMVDKRGLAARYGVGIRTVEAWQGDGIIIGSRVATKWPTTLARKGCPFLDLPSKIRRP